MTSSGHLSADRVGLRTSYLPTLRYVLTKPLATLDKEGIPQVIETMSVCTASSVYPFRSVTALSAEAVYKIAFVVCMERHMSSPLLYAVAADGHLLWDEALEAAKL